MARLVLVTEAQFELAHRYPGRFSAPARLDELCFERQHRLECVAALGRRLFLEPSDEAQVADLDLYVHAHTSTPSIAVAGGFMPAALCSQRLPLGGTSGFFKHPHRIPEGEQARR